MSEDKFNEGGRDFLNRPGFHEDASIAWILSVSSSGYFNGSISFRDCSENICLELNVHNDEWYDNSIDKIDKIITHLKEVKKQLPRARRALQKAKAKAKKK